MEIKKVLPEILHTLAIFLKKKKTSIASEPDVGCVEAVIKKQEGASQLALCSFHDSKYMSLGA